MESPVNLNSAVGRARVGCPGVIWQGATTQLASASKEEQRRQSMPGRLNRVRSVLTQMVGSKKGEITVHYKHLGYEISG